MECDRRCDCIIEVDIVERGVQGPIGPQGPQGIIGPQGPRGETGGLFCPEFDVDPTTGILSVTGIEKSGLGFKVNPITGNLEVEAL